MANVDLLFRQVPLSGNPVDLLFGETESLPDISGTLSGALPGLGGAVQVRHLHDLSVSGTLPGLGGTISLLEDDTQDITVGGVLPGLGGAVTLYKVREAAISGALPGLGGVIAVQIVHPITIGGALPGLGGLVNADFDVAVERPTVGQTTHPHQEAVHLNPGVDARTQGQLHHFDSMDGQHQTAARLEVSTADAVARMDQVKVNGGAAHTGADKLRTQVLSPHQEMLHDRRPSLRTSHQEGVDLRTQVTTDSQDRYRDRRPSVTTANQTAQTLRKWWGWKTGVAIHVRKAWDSRHQEAIVPPAGVETITLPEPHVCYTPNAHLLFSQAPGDSHLLFICDNQVIPPDGTVVVPIKRVYIVLNDVYLKRVVGNLMLPATSLSLSIDADSWTWSFNASLPFSSLDDIMPISGQPVELEASVNGNPYRVLVENISRERVFGSRSIRISGRGKSALLAAPYAPVMAFANTEERTAQQLMADVLTFNGVPLDWDVDWQLEDWLVPAGAFSQQGSYMDALNSIVGAAGAYLQPHPTDQSLSALLRYPVAPWNWATEVTPDFSIPAAVMTREGIEWVQKPDYNRVFIGGTGQGILGDVKITGSAGDLLAPGVNDPLITEAVAARQRGIAILGDTGRQAMVTVSLPVLDETGVIPPGKFVEYTDGSVVRIGLNRSTAVDFGKAGVGVRQTLVLETHDA